jgi:Uma2 family endonuclease
MAPPGTIFLTVQQFDALYSGESGWEYWFGEARRKPVATYLHGILQGVLVELLIRAGYIASAETDLKIAPRWQPRPDVIGVLELRGKYITRPKGVVAFEILSEDDPILEKCENYAQIGIRQVFVFDPVNQTIAAWIGRGLEPVQMVKLANGVTITAATVWNELFKRQQPQPPSSLVT